MPKGLPNIVRSHLEKARESAILAVEIYNKPSTQFRSGGFIVLMIIAWTSLFHAIFYRKKIKPFYKTPSGRHYLKVDGDYKAWELGTCIEKHFGGTTTPERKNLEFFVTLRNKIEHRLMPALDPQIFGECQALLLNFEDLLLATFGPKHGLHDSPTLAIQFSALRDSLQAKAIKKLHGTLSTDLQEYLETFRSSLTADIRNDLRYSFKVFLIPKIANHPGQADVAVEFIKYDPEKPDEMQQYEKIVAMIKPAAIPVANQGTMKPGDICKAVEPVVEAVVGNGTKFNASYHHAKACTFYKIRPQKGQGDPRKTIPAYCQYDDAHKDYVYTVAWRDFLIAEMKKPGQYLKIVATP